MANLSKSQLLERVTQVVVESNDNIVYLNIKHPFTLSIYNATEQRSLKVYIWNVSHGGNHRPRNEYRIQAKGAGFFTEPNTHVLILGWWEEGNVFVGFDFRKHSGNIGLSPSLQVKEETLRNAYIHGIAPYRKENGETAIAFRPEFLAYYAFNAEALHDFGKSISDYKALVTIASQAESHIATEILDTVASPRKNVLQTINKKLRDSSFRSRILTSYGFRCAFCNLQLKLVEAAHILPVSYEFSTDETRNGIALCALHHKAYDTGLVTMTENYEVIYHKEKFDNLKTIGHDGGMESFIQHLKPLINLPPALHDRPHQDYIRQANILRGWFAK